jgi:2-amino-4-hydroxy-6-hydroxymethyldihydropteridine diphosphokinase
VPTEPLPHLYIVALGSNLGDRQAWLKEAVGLLAARVGPILAQSPSFATAPIGAADQEFLNGAVLIASAQGPASTLKELLLIETRLGRLRREPKGNRNIDLDLLLWRQAEDAEGVACRRLSTDALDLPHPRMLERDFVMVPAAAVAPRWVHPETGRTLADEVAARGYRLI